MGMKYLLILSMVVLTTLGCKSSQKTGGDAADPSLARLNVSFYSIGSGINHVAQKEFEAFLGKYQEANGVELKHDVIHWGREGETDYCFKLTELKAKAQEAFIAETKKALEGKEHVNVNENFKCRPSRF